MKQLLRLACVLLAGLSFASAQQTIVTATLPALASGTYAAQQTSGGGLVSGSINASGNFRALVQASQPYLFTFYPSAASGYPVFAVSVNVQSSGTQDISLPLSGALPRIQTATSIGTLYGFGDSTMAGSYASPVSASMFSILSRDYLGNVMNFGIPGAYMSNIANSAFGSTNFPALLGTEKLPTIVENGGINDANGIGATTGSINNYTLELNASMYWLDLLPANKVMASAATISGFGATYNGPAVNGVNSGTPKQSITVGDTLTFTGTAIGSKVGLTYAPRASGTGTFTVSLNGTLQTDMCSGTTTFSAFGCNSQAVAADTFARQEFSVTPGSAFTLVVTVTGTTGATNIVSVFDVDLTPTSPAGLPTYIMSGVIKQNLDADSAATAAFNTAAAAVTAEAVADNLNATFADVRNGSPGVNSTTDMAASTPACPSIAGNTPLHPNACGYLHWAQTIEAAAKGAFHPGLGGKPTTLIGPPQSYIPTLSSDITSVSWLSNVNSLVPTASFWSPMFCSYPWTFCTGINYSPTQGTYTNAITTPTTAAIQKCTGSTPAGCVDDSWWDANGNQHALSGYIGPATEPTGACPTNGIWQFTQDGHASVCLAFVWTQKF